MSKEGTVAEYGMLATEDIDEGEVLFTIPRSALLHQGTSEVSALLEKGDNSLFGCFSASCSFALLSDFSPYPPQRNPLWRARLVGCPCCWLCCMNIRLPNPTGNPTSLCGPILNHWTTPCSGEIRFKSGVRTCTEGKPVDYS